MVGSSESFDHSTFPENLNFAFREVGFFSKVDGLGVPEILISSESKDMLFLSLENSTFVASLSTYIDAMLSEVS